MTMPPLLRWPARLLRPDSLRAGALLFWFALYLLFSMPTHLFYQAQGTIFSLAPEYLAPFLHTAGGLLEYADRFLEQLLAWDEAGALLLVAEAWAIGVLSGAYFSRIAGRPAPAARFLPMALFMFEWTQYSPATASGPALIALLGCALAFGSLPVRSRWGRFATYLPVSGLFLYAAAGAYLKLNLVLSATAFASLCALQEARRAGKVSPGWTTAYLLTPAVLAAAGELTFLSANADLWSRWTRPLLVPAGVLHAALFLSLPLAGLWLLLDPLARRRRVSQAVETAPALWPSGTVPRFDIAPKIHYDLMRATFHPETGRFDAPELVVPAGGKSIVEARVSPEGRFLLATRCRYGAFPIMQQESDLILVDLKAKGFPWRRVEESPASLRDSWHCWSSSGRWIIFSRKKENPLLARPHLRYIDAGGNVSKAFVVPQEDPTTYDRCLDTFNAPELVNGPVTISEKALARAALGE